MVRLLNDGYALLQWMRDDYSATGKSGQSAREMRVEAWGQSVLQSLRAIFPTELECNQFLNAPVRNKTRFTKPDTDVPYRDLRERHGDLLAELARLRHEALSLYTDLPGTTRIYIEDIDSFSKVRDVNPAMVADLLDSNGWMDASEDSVQMAIEQILDVPFHKKDWAGEYNDLYTANIQLNGTRRATAFMLKGNGLRNKTMEITHCGKNGDQLVRLVESPADLFIVQFVGNVSESVVKDIAGKVEELRARGRPACFCIINGQDTARLLRAYGKA